LIWITTSGGKSRGPFRAGPLFQPCQPFFEERLAPQAHHIAGGQASAFAYNGADPLSYYWTLNGSHVGSNSDTYALQNPIADMTYTIKVRITDAEGDTGSAVQSVTIPSCDPTKLIC